MNASNVFLAFALVAILAQGVRKSQEQIGKALQDEAELNKEISGLVARYASDGALVAKATTNAEPLCTQHDETAYDAWIETCKASGTCPPSNLQSDAKRLVFVIDMQVDFVEASFQMPCERKRAELTENLVKFVRNEFESGATIISSLDWHPKGHCGSFMGGNCANQHDPLENGQQSADKKFYASGDASGRYINMFPPHCEWTVVDGRSSPSEGAKYFPAINQALQDLAATDSTRVHTVFKGFNENIDSFSAMGMIKNASGSEEKFTGGFEIPGGWSSDCYIANPGPECFPTVEQLANPGTMTSVSRIVKDVEFDEVIVVGLVWDFCVKETAFNLKALFPGKQVIVPVELSRPACEGGPLPASGAAELHPYPPLGLGTPEILAKTGQEYVARDVQLVSVTGL